MDRSTEIRTEIQKLEDELKALQAELAATRATEREQRLVAATEAVVNAAPSAFVTDNPYAGQHVRAVLPFGRDYGKWNPRDVENAAFGKNWLAGSTAIICKRLDEQRTRPTRLVFTSGSPSEGDKIGSRFMARHDQTNAALGEYEVVGLVMYDQDGNVARIVGDVPNIKFSQSTYK